MTWAARSLMWPSFDFRGAGGMARYGGLMAAGQLFWFVQSQADVFIAGRLFDPHWLGIYTTSLFLTQILVQKFIPALNEVAFSAYSRMQHDAAGATIAFAKSVRLIMVAAMPFYLGLAATAEPLVHVALGEKWIDQRGTPSDAALTRLDAAGRQSGDCERERSESEAPGYVRHHGRLQREATYSLTVGTGSR